MGTPELTIIVAAFDRKDALIETIMQLRAGTGVDYELLIYDNSEEPLLAGFPFQHHEQYTHTGANLGAKARRFGIQAAKADVILMLDDDSNPVPGAVAVGIARLRELPETCAGLVARVVHPNGGSEAALLPTVALGCGVMFRTKAIRAINGGYPEHFVYYGEEYWQSLNIHQNGYHLSYCPELTISHRTIKDLGAKQKIFYFLARNNDVIWQRFMPAPFMDQILYDTRRRYELTATREGVTAELAKGFNEALTAADEGKGKPLTEEQFRRFALLDAFDAALPGAPDKVAFCGAGKFPSFWADYVLMKGVQEVRLLDLNPALIGQHYGDHAVYGPGALEQTLADGFVPLLGHASTVHDVEWMKRLDALQCSIRISLS